MSIAVVTLADVDERYSIAAQAKGVADHQDVRPILSPALCLIDPSPVVSLQSITSGRHRAHGRNIARDGAARVHVS